MKRKKINSNTPSLPLIIGSIAVCSALLYAGFVAYPFISGPQLSAHIDQSETGEIVITGTTNRVSSLWVNELPTPITDQGTFSTARAYPPGYTVVVVRAEDRFGRFKEKTLTFVNSPHIPYASEEENDTEESSDQEDRNGDT